MTHSFKALGLQSSLLTSLETLNFSEPTAVQAQAIPYLLEGQDVLAQAQTGSGKTAAFALPILQSIDISEAHSQCLVLVPTRELAIQVAEAISSLGQTLKGLKVCAIYGGEEYGRQLKALKRGPQIVVGTPGRVMDHLRRKTLKLGQLTHLVLDEADEMLRMGFHEDVTWILQHVPEEKQTALFSATMPKAIKNISNDFLHKPQHIHIKSAGQTKPDIHQQYVIAPLVLRSAVIARLLEFRRGQGVIIFTRTKNQTIEVSAELKALGFKAEAINGDINQTQRKRVLDQLQSAEIDILVATDVAARGIDISRIDCVFNFEAPFDKETYVHRIGRTGRAGRKGEAILLLSARERFLLRKLQEITSSPIEELNLPSAKKVNAIRQKQFCDAIIDASQSKRVEQFLPMIEKLKEEASLSLEQIAATIAYLSNQNTGLLDESNDKLLTSLKKQSTSKRNKREHDGGGRMKFSSGKERREKRFESSEPMSKFKIFVGREHGAKPKNIVGAIANEANLSSRNIGEIEILKQHSFVYLPKAKVKQICQSLKSTRVCGLPIKIRLADTLKA